MQQRYNQGGGGPRGPGGGGHRPGGGGSGGHGGHGGRNDQRPPTGQGGGSGGTPGNGGRSAEIDRALKPPETREPYFQPNSRAPRPALLDADAQRVARDLASVPASQLRRFYAEVMALKRRLDLDAALPGEEIMAHLALLKAKAAYTCKRARDYPIALVRFFTLHAASVDDREKFVRGFQPHFEAVMAYHRVFEQKKGDHD